MSLNRQTLLQVCSGLPARAEKILYRMISRSNSTGGFSAAASFDRLAGRLTQKFKDKNVRDFRATAHPGVPVLSSSDIFAEKLLANADRCVRWHTEMSLIWGVSSWLRKSRPARSRRQRA
jgi:hypothetical protein